MNTNANPTTATDSNNYNSRMSSCPGYESAGLRGYVDLLSLQTDIFEYYSSSSSFLLFPTSSPSNSHMPTSDTAAPSWDPTYSPQPSIFTYTPTERLTRRPSPFPTSDIRVPFKPTSSPAPTITMAVYDGGGSGNNNDTTSISVVDEDDDQGLNNLLPEEPGTIGYNGTLPSELNITNSSNNSTNTTDDAVNNATTTTTNNTVAAAAAAAEDFVMGEVPSSASPSSSSQLIGGRLLPQEQEQVVVPTKVSFFICPNTVLSFEEEGSSSNSSPIILETSARNNHAVEIACISAPPEMASTSSSSRSCVMSGGKVHVYVKYIPGYDSEDGADDINNDNVVTSNEDGMTTTNNATSTTAGTSTTNNATAALDEPKEEGEEAKDQYGSITISGIVFRNAIQSSIVMNDPRGKIYFKDCAWENNSGEATVMINGRYNSTSTTTGSQEGEGGGMNDDAVVGDFGVVGEGGLGGGEEQQDGAASSNSSTVSTTSSTVNFANFILTTTAGSSTTTTPMLDADATLSPFAITNDDDDEMMTLATSGPPNDDENNRELFLMDQVVDFRLMTSRQPEEENLYPGKRLLEANNTPFSMIIIENCVFSGNKGNSTIIVSSNFEELVVAEQDLGSLDANGGRYLQFDSSSPPKFAHWIHVEISNTSFTTETVNGSIIDNYGGRLQLTGCTYVNNTVESIVKSEYGTVAMSSTQFDMNDVQGDVGVVVLDSESSLELNEGNCDAAASSTNIRCGGIDYGGVCIAFDSCDPSTNETTLDVVGNGGTNETTPSVVGDGAPCFTDWDDLVVAVRDRPNDRIDFIICPGAALVATVNPVIINANGITIQCGTASSQSKNCFISGGYSHFHVEGSAAGVQLARLSMSASTGSNIMGLGTSDASLIVRDCEFIMNEGSTAIIINNGEIMSSSTSAITTGANTAATTAAMSVEVVNCTFARNKLSFGAISNNGGALSVVKSRFTENSGTGGNIIVMKRGTCKIQGCCFGLSSSASPGTIYVDAGSIVIGNENNFGSENTAGGLSDGSTCFDIFQEAQDSDCLIEGSSKCAGSCKSFTASTCQLDVENENSAANKDITVPAFNKDEGSQSSKIVPIVVATVVCVLIVFGLIGIILRRRKSNVRHSQRRGTNRREYDEVDDGDFHY